MSVLDYWRTVFRQAMAETWASIGVNVQTFGVALTMVSLLVLGITTVREVGETVILTIAPALLTFAWMLVRTPATLHDTLRNDAEVRVRDAQEQRDVATQALETIRTTGPRLAIIGARTVQKMIRRYNEHLGSPHVVQVEFVNDPIHPVDTAIVTELYAEVAWSHVDGTSIFERLPGRWENSPAPTNDTEPVAPARLGIGERRTLDLAIQHPGARMYAFTNWSYRARDWQYDSLALGAVDGAWRVEIHLRGPRVDQTFEVAIIDSHQSGPPMIYTNGIESIFRDHPSMRAWRARFRQD